MVITMIIIIIYPHQHDLIYLNDLRKGSIIQPPIVTIFSIIARKNKTQSLHQVYQRLNCPVVLHFSVYRANLVGGESEVVYVYVYIAHT